MSTPLSPETLRRICTPESLAFQSTEDLQTLEEIVAQDWAVQAIMLREDVVEAARQGQFHVYPVRTIDEGIALLTGVPAGEIGPDGEPSGKPASETNSGQN